MSRPSVGEVDPLLKWPGGKRELAEKIARVYDGNPRRYVETMCGGLAVYLRRLARGELRDAAVVLADAEPRLMAFYRAMRDLPGEVYPEIAAFDWGPTWKADYYDVREQFNLWRPGPLDTASPVEAARMIWINRAGFNGLYRVNQSGGYNVPAGDYAKIPRPGLHELLRFGEALYGVELLTVRAVEMLADCRRGDHVYEDPPYVDMFDQYTPEGFSFHDHVELALATDRARGRGAFCALSNSNTPRTRALYKAFDFEVQPLLVTRSIAAAAESRGKESELLVLARPG